MNCPEVRQLCAVYLDGELTPAEAAALDAHLAECESCAAELELEREVAAALREGAVSLAAPEGFARSVTAALAARQRGRPARLAALAGRWRHALAAAAAVLLVATAALGHGMQQWLVRTPVVAVNPADSGGQAAPIRELEPDRPAKPPEPPVGDKVTAAPDERPAPGSTGSEPGAVPGEDGPDKVEAAENGAQPEAERATVTVALDPEPEPKALLNKPRTISTTFVKLSVPELGEAREKALAVAESYGASYQAQGAQAGTPGELELRFSVDPARAGDFVDRLSELGVVVHRQSDRREITRSFAAVLEQYQVLLARRARVENPDEQAALDEQIASLEQKLTEWNQDAERHTVVLMLLQEN
jgi:anti-sigma factor (TIGR02949 family)